MSVQARDALIDRLARQLHGTGVIMTLESLTLSQLRAMGRILDDAIGSVYLTTATSTLAVLLDDSGQMVAVVHPDGLTVA